MVSLVQPILRFLGAIVLCGAFNGWPPARAADPPASPSSPISWTFWAPGDFMDWLGTESSGDPFASGGEPPLKPSPPPPAIWKESLGFFDVGSVEDAPSVLVAARIRWTPSKGVAFLHKEDERLDVRCSREAAELVAEFMQGVRPSPTRNMAIEVLVIGLTDPGACGTLAESEDARAAAESPTPTAHASSPAPRSSPGRASTPPSAKAACPARNLPSPPTSRVRQREPARLKPPLPSSPAFFSRPNRSSGRMEAPSTSPLI